MKKLTKIILLTFITVLILIALFPPFAVMKIDGNNIVKHDFVGYFPIWNSPSEIFAYEFLEKKPFVNNTS